MTPDELRGILNSDMKLWEAARTSKHPKGTAKTIVLPYGIGERTLVFEKVDRNSVGMFGGMIRDLVNAARGEEALAAARAVRNRSEEAIEAARERAGPALGEDTGLQRESNASRDAEVSGEEAIPALGETEDIAAGLVVRRDACLDRLAQLRMMLDRYEDAWSKSNKELKMLTRLLEVASACEDDGAKRPDIQREVPPISRGADEGEQRVADPVRADVATSGEE